MKIIDRKEFYNLPPGTLFTEYSHVAFNGLKIKEDTLYGDDLKPFDYIEFDLIGNIRHENSEKFYSLCVDAFDNKISLKLDFDDDNTVRNSLYDSEQLYAIYEEDDIRELIKKLNKLL